MGTLRRVTLGALCWGTCAVAGDKSLPSELFDEAPGQVFKVVLSTRLEGEQKTHGTGFAVGEDGLVATAFHVVHGLIDEQTSANFRPQVFVVRKGIRVQAEIWAVDPVNDLAILKIPVHFGHPWPIAEEVQKKGADVFLLGYPGPGDFSVISGRLQSAGMSAVVPKYQITAAVTGGMSGGPVLNEKHEIVGVVLAVYEGGSQLSVASQSSPLQAILKEARAVERAPTMEELSDSAHAGFLRLQEEETKLLRQLFSAKSAFHGWNLPSTSKAKTDMACGDAEDDLYHSRRYAATRYCRFKMATNEDEVEFNVTFSVLPNLHNQFKMASESARILNENRRWKGSRRKFGKFACEPDTRLKLNGSLFVVSACSRLSNSTLDVLHTVIRASSLDLNKPGVAARLDLVGFTKPNAAEIATKFINSLELDHDYEDDDEE